MLKDGGHQSPAKAAGFTLIEAVMGIGLLTVSALGVAVLFGMSMRATLSAKAQTSTGWLAAQKMEQLRALAWGVEEGAGSSIGPSISDRSTNVSVEPAIDGGVGLSAAPPDVLGRNQPPYVDFLDAHGVWLGTGAVAPPGTVFIRRWSIDPLPADPADTLVLQVLVTTYARTHRRRVTGELLPEDTLLVNVKTRKAW